MTRILVQRGSGSSSSNQNQGRAPSSSLPQGSAPNAASASKEDEQEREVLQDPGGLDVLIEQTEGPQDKSVVICDEFLTESSQGTRINTGSGEAADKEKSEIDEAVDSMKDLELEDLGGSVVRSSQIVLGGTNPPPPPVPTPKPPASNFNTRRTHSSGNAGRVDSPRRQSGWPVVSTRSSPSGSRISSPRAYGDGEGYNSADEQGPCFVSAYDDSESGTEKHVVGFIAGLTAPPGRRMGHAGAIVSGGMCPDDLH